MLSFTHEGKKSAPDFEYTSSLSDQNPSSTNVSISIIGKERLGDTVSIQLEFDSVWVLTSEVNIEASEAILDEKYTFKYLEEDVEDAGDNALVRNEEALDSKAHTETLDKGSHVETEDKDSQKNQHNEDERIYLEVIVGVLSAFSLLLLILFVALVAYGKRNKMTMMTPGSMQVNMKDLLMTLSPSSHNGLSSVAAGNNSSTPNIIANPAYSGNFATAPRIHENKLSGDNEHLLSQLQPQEGTQPQLMAVDSNGRWHSTGHVALMDYGRAIYGQADTINSGSESSSGGSRSNRHNSSTVSEYASVDIRAYGGNGLGTSLVNLQAQQQHPYYSARLSQPPPPPPPLPPMLLKGKPCTTTFSGSASYNLGQYFPRVASEPPKRKSYGNSMAINVSST